MNKQPTPKEISSKPKGNAEVLIANLPLPDDLANSLVQHSTSREEHPVIDLRKEPVAVDTEENDQQEEAGNKEVGPSELQESQLTGNVGMDVPK